MNKFPRILPATIRRLSCDEAWANLLVPCAEEGDLLECYGETGRDYACSTHLLENLYAIRIKITFITKVQLQSLLRKYYPTASPLPDTMRQNDTRNNLLREIIQQALELKASHIHIEDSDHCRRIRLRIGGILDTHHTLSDEEYSSLREQLASLHDGQAAYGIFDYGAGQIGVHTSLAPTFNGERIVLRLTPIPQPTGFSRFGFTAEQEQAYSKAVDGKCGLILICGNSTRHCRGIMHATLARLDRSSRNILCTDAPDEEPCKGVNYIRFPHRGMPLPDKLRFLGSQDPDTVALAEIYDAESAMLAIRCAAEGMRVLSTMDAADTISGLSRLTAMGVPADLLARSVSVCIGTGFAGRQGLVEVIPSESVPWPALAHGRPDVRDIIARNGVKTLRRAAIEMIGSGEATLDECLPLLYSATTADLPPSSRK